MDTEINYDQLQNSELRSRHYDNSYFFHTGRRWGYVLYSGLLALLLLLLLITGLKFSQVQQEVSDVKLLLLSIKKSKPENLTTLLEHSSECAEGWEQWERGCYLLSSEKMNWHNAEAACVEQGAHLVVINTEQEQHFFASWLEKLPRQSFWIGLTDKNKESEWEWVDGTAYNDTPHFWDVGQPDDWEHVGLAGEDCVQFHSFSLETADWNDGPCTTRSRYACEKQLH
ncbi:hepatic lectin isoform X2 [Amia ocellicauda]